MSKLIEEWRPIQGYEGLYEVSDWGNVKSLERYFQNHGKLQHVNEKTKAPQVSKSEHLFVMLYKNGKYEHFQVHRLVAEAFLPNPNGYDIVHHKDGNPKNNRVENLEWMTKQQHQALHMEKERGKPVDKIDKITGEVLASYPSVNEAARQNGFYQIDISDCCRGKRKTAYKFKWGYIMFN